MGDLDLDIDLVRASLEADRRWPLACADELAATSAAAPATTSFLRGVFRFSFLSFLSFFAPFPLAPFSRNEFGVHISFFKSFSTLLSCDTRGAIAWSILRMELAHNVATNLHERVIL